MITCVSMEPFKLTIALVHWTYLFSSLNSRQILQCSQLQRCIMMCPKLHTYPVRSCLVCVYLVRNINTLTPLFWSNDKRILHPCVNSNSYSKCIHCKKWQNSSNHWTKKEKKKSIKYFIRVLRNAIESLFSSSRCVRFTHSVSFVSFVALICN